MKNVDFSSWRLANSLLIALLVASFNTGKAAELKPADPGMGYRLDARVSGSISSAKLEKLTENLQHAAEDYRAGRFERAAHWYQSALIVDPERKDVQEALLAAKQMHEAQNEALKRLPEDPKERQRFYEMAYESALQYLND